MECKNYEISPSVGCSDGREKRRRIQSCNGLYKTETAVLSLENNAGGAAWIKGA